MGLVLVGPEHEAETYDGVFAVDPGLKTGWAFWLDGTVKTGETQGQLEFVAAAWEAALKFRPVIVCEAYIISSETAKKSRQYEPLEIIGTLRWFAHLLNLPFHLQTPSQAKGFSTDDKLKAVEWWVPGQGHGMDAARHLLRYMVSERREDALIDMILEGLG